MWAVHPLARQFSQFFRKCDAAKYASKSILTVRNCSSSNDGIGMDSSTAAAEHAHHVQTEVENEANKSKLVDKNTPVSAEEIKLVVEQHGKPKVDNTGYVMTCPRIKLLYEEPLFDKLHVDRNTGYFECDACGKSGAFHHLVQNLNAPLTAGINTTVPDSCFDGIKLPAEKTLSKRHQTDFDACTPVNSVSEETLNAVLELVDMKALSRATLEKFDARINDENQSLILPYYSTRKQLIAYGVISVVEGKGEKKRIKKTFMGKTDETVFGLHTLDSKSAELCLVEDEADAMAIYQETKVPVIALAKCKLPQEVLYSLDRFKKISIWIDDKSGSAASYARKLGERRCFVIRQTKTEPGAYKAIANEQTLHPLISQGKPVANGFIVSFHDVRDEVQMDLLNADKMAGIKWKRFTKLNEILKGHRRGELTIFTGPTGAGKTTFISEYSLDLCESGVNTLWGSFEIGNKRLMRTMLTQFAGCNLEANPQEFNEHANQFEQLPMYFMTFHGQEHIQRVLKTMSHAVHVKDISHVIIDNLQFMMGSDTNSHVDKFQQQDAIIAALRNFATVMDCHVTLIIHPRKEKEEMLTLQSIFGSAKSSQEADNVIILQQIRFSESRTKLKKYIEIVKHRYEGGLGIMSLRFDKESLTFSNRSPKQEQHSNQSTKFARKKNTDGDDFEVLALAKRTKLG